MGYLKIRYIFVSKTIEPQSLSPVFHPSRHVPNIVFLAKTGQG